VRKEEKLEKGRAQKVEKCADKARNCAGARSID
jgi:hypothetical protein